MKNSKIQILIGLLMMFAPAYALADSVDIQPNPIPYADTPVNVYVSPANTTYALGLFDPEGNLVGVYQDNSSGDSLAAMISSPVELGTYHAVAFLRLDDTDPDNPLGVCTVYSDCIASDQYQGIDISFHQESLSNAPSSGGGFGGLIANADSGFASTTGFNMAAVITFTGDNLIKLFIGSGLAVLWNLREWIAALGLIGGILYFVYRVWRESHRMMK